MLSIDRVHLELYSNNFGGTKLKRLLHLGVREQKSVNNTALNQLLV
jgi:hypothetical protein